MKRTMIAAVLLAALVLGVVAYATAAPNDVVVTARVNPAISITLNQNAVSWLDVNYGAALTDASTLITVKSNKTWTFTKTGGPAAPLDAVLTDATSLAPASGIAKGVHNITATYVLDLSTDAAYDLDPGTDYTATYTYTAVQ